MTGGRARHGARHPGAPRRDRALLHPHPARTTARRPSNWPNCSGATTPSAALSPLTERTAAQVEGIRPRPRRPGPRPIRGGFGAKHTDPFIEDGAAELAAHGVGTRHRPGAHPARLVHGLGRVPGAGRPAALGGRVPFTADRAVVRPSGLHPSSWPSGSRGAVVAQRQRSDPVIFTAHSLPERVRAAGDAYPEQLEESARLVAEAAGVSRLAGGLAERRPHARAVVGPRHPRRGAATGRPRGDRRGRRLPHRLRGRPLGSALRHRHRTGRRGRRVGLRLARTASLNDDPRLHRSAGRRGARPRTRRD